MSKLTKEQAIRYVSALSRVTTLAELSIISDVGVPGNNLAAIGTIGQLMKSLQEIVLGDCETVTVTSQVKPNLPCDGLPQAVGEYTIHIETLMQELTMLKATVVNSSVLDVGDEATITFDLRPEDGPCVWIVADKVERSLNLKTIERRARFIILGEQIDDSVYYHTFEVSKFDRTWTSSLGVNTKYSVE